MNLQDMMEKVCPFSMSSQRPSNCIGQRCMAFGRLTPEDCYCTLIEAAMIKLVEPVSGPLDFSDVMPRTETQADAYIKYVTKAESPQIPEGYTIRELKHD